MAASKYDKYKHEFINLYCLGEIDTFADYARKMKWVKKSISEKGSMGKLSIKWTKEANAILGKLQQSVEKTLEEKIQITKNQALKIKRVAFKLMLDRMNKRKDKLTASELKTIWNAARTEAGEVIQITKSTIGEDKENPFTTIADVLNSITGSCEDSTIDEKPPKGSG